MAWEGAMGWGSQLLEALGGSRHEAVLSVRPGLEPDSCKAIW